MTNTDDGGPMFPSVGGVYFDDRGKPRYHDGRHIVMTGGLSVRDWYEGNALASMWWWLPIGLKQRVARRNANAMIATRKERND